MKRFFSALAALTLAACANSSDGEEEIVDQWRTVPIAATPIEFPERIGRLRFRGGVALTSSDDVWGGLSGMELMDGRHLLIANDDAEWFDAQLVLDDDGDLIGVERVLYALMRDERGAPLPNDRGGDSEGLAQLPDGRFAVSFEQTQTIRIYDINRDGPFGAATPGPRLAALARLPPNAGLEAIAATADGQLLIGAEGGGGASTPLWRAPLDAQAPVAPLIGFPTSDAFSLTGLDRLPNGDFIAVLRFYAPVVGAKARIMRFPAAALDSGAAILPDVELLGEIAPPLPVDNFEAIAATRMPDGATRLYILSDDNYAPRQRTLLLAFDIIEN